MTLAVKLQSVEVMLGKQRLLGPLDLELTDGEHVLVVGPSGSGKTTLLRVIAGLQSPSKGRVEIAERLADDGPTRLLPASKRAVGYLFQGGALWPHMSVKKTLDFVLRHAGLARRERSKRIRELVDLVELTGLEKRKPSQLSGGEAQRLALARALAGSPRILLLDEPLGPLDSELRETMIRRLAKIHEELGLTTLHVTHDPREVSQLADRTLTLRDGRWTES